MCTGIGGFDGTFSLQLKEDSKLCQAIPRSTALCIVKTIQDRTKWLQQKSITTPLGVDDGYSGATVLYWEQRQIESSHCLDPARFNEALIRPVHGDSNVNDIFIKPTNAKYLIPIDMNFGYHNMQLDEIIIIFYYIPMPVWQV